MTTGDINRQTSARVLENQPSRALVAVTPVKLPPRPEADPPRTTTRPSAVPFLAHLVAMRDQAPQTRQRRRAEPAEAIQIYQAQTVTAPATPGRQMSRFM